MVKVKPSPYATANCVSRILFWWLNPFMWLGGRRELNIEDLHETIAEDRSTHLGDLLSDAWEKELSRAQCATKSGATGCEDSRSKPMLANAIADVFLGRYMTWAILAFLEECVFKVAQPVALGFLLRYYANAGDYPWYTGYLWISVIIGSGALINLVHHPYFFAACHMGMQAMKLSQSALKQTAVGQMVNLLSNDVNRFDVAAIFLQYLWIAPCQLLISTVILWLYFGVSSVIGLCLLALFVPLQTYLGKLFSKYRAETAVRTDARIRVLNEIIGGIKVIKMYTWEKPFAALLHQARKDEVSYISRTSRLRALNMTLFFTSGKIVSFIVLLCYLLFGYRLNAEKVFVLLALSNNVRLGMTFFFTLANSQYAEVTVSIRRIQNFLMLKEQPESIQFHSIATVSEGHAIVMVERLYAKWSPANKHFTLENISLEVKPGQLLGIVGPVGCGKGSLLQAILQELEVTTRGTIGYAAQEPWLFSGSVLDNILFGRPYNDRWFSQVIEACALTRDLEIMAHGVHTLVGEKGSMLSGGQKARVALARAVYANADIYLLDDPLSAVDAEVGLHLFEKCIRVLLAKKVNILVTHQLQFLPKVDFIIVLENGRIAAKGTYDDLISQGINFDQILARESHPPDDLPVASIQHSTLTASRPVTAGSRKSLCSQNDESPSSLPGSPAKDGEMISNGAGKKYMFVGTTENPNNNEVSTAKICAVDSRKNLPSENAESRGSGTISLSLYFKYFTAGANCCAVFAFIIFTIACHVSLTGSDYWLKIWTGAEETRRNGNTTIEEINYTELFEDFVERINYDRATQLYGYTILVVANFLFSWLRNVFYFHICLKSSIALHHNMFEGVIRAPTLFFDKNPQGRILNRFSSDMGQVDDLLPVTLFDSSVIFLTIAGIIVLISIVNPLLVAPSIVLLSIFYGFKRFYLRAARSVKRIEGVCRSPVFSHLNTSLFGLTTIRAFKAQKEATKLFDQHMDQHSSAWFIFISTSRWFGVWLDWLSLALISIVTYSFVMFPAESSAVGLSISSVLMLSGMFQWGIRQSAEAENQMIAVERIMQYSTIEPEASLKSTSGRKPPPNWPQAGEVRMENVFASYDDVEVLHGISAHILPSETVGIVGRTGAGKSTFVSVLFRLIEPKGSIWIDGVDITKIGLHDLRAKIAIIPQEPVLFAGTIRRNLDPFALYSDSKIWAALDASHLGSTIRQSPLGLDSEVSENGTNISVGQRQLICLARAILRKNKILVLDEATANVDLETDALIQDTLKTQFSLCTVLTVAHRLHTVMGCDRIMVLDAGRIVEFEKPLTLLENAGSVLSGLVRQTGNATAEELMRIAKSAAEVPTGVTVASNT